MAYDDRNYDASTGLQTLQHVGSGSLYRSGGSRGAYDHLGPASSSRPTFTRTRHPVAASDMKTCDTDHPTASWTSLLGFQ